MGEGKERSGRRRGEEGEDRDRTDKKLKKEGVKGSTNLYLRGWRHETQNYRKGLKNREILKTDSKRAHSTLLATEKKDTDITISPRPKSKGVEKGDGNLHKKKKSSHQEKRGNQKLRKKKGRMLKRNGKTDKHEKKRAKRKNWELF